MKYITQDLIDFLKKRIDKDLPSDLIVRDGLVQLLKDSQDPDKYQILP